MFLPGPETAPKIGVEFAEAEGEEDAGEEGEGEEGEGEGEGGVGWHFTRQRGGGGMKGWGGVWELFEEEQQGIGRDENVCAPKKGGLCASRTHVGLDNFLNCV